MVARHLSHVWHARMLVLHECEMFLYIHTHFSVFVSLLCVGRYHRPTCLLLLPAVSCPLFGWCLYCLLFCRAPIVILTLALPYTRRTHSKYQHEGLSASACSGSRVILSPLSHLSTIFTFVIIALGIRRFGSGNHLYDASM